MEDGEEEKEQFGPVWGDISAMSCEGKKLMMGWFRAEGHHCWKAEGVGWDEKGRWYGKGVVLG